MHQQAHGRAGIGEGEAMSKTARQAERVTGHPPGMLQDDSRELTAWLAGRPDAMRNVRDAAATIRAERVSAADELNSPEGCGNCHTCAPNRIGGPMRMIVCPECGNKRCPHATDHRNACTGSNEPGQTGSAYPAVPTLDEVRVQCAPLVSAIKSEWRTDHVEDLRAMVPCAVCAVGHATLQRDASGYYRACEACGSDYAGTDELALQRGHVVDADKMVEAVAEDSSATRPGAAARAKLEATPEGRALLAAAKTHLLQCLQLTPEGVEAFMVPTAAAMEVRPCYCGPDGCADSVACPMGGR